MKIKVAWIIAGFVIGGWKLALTAAEHPTGTQEHPTEMKKEHPTEAKKEHPTEMKKEHPTEAKKEHPKEHPEAAKGKSFQNEYEKVVKNYLSAESIKTGGVFTIKDDAGSKEWKLKLLKVHKSKICLLQEGKTCFACADFKEVGGKNKLDLDFYANKSPEGKITIDKVLIHKVNGKQRFTYDANNNLIPVKG